MKALTILTLMTAMLLFGACSQPYPDLPSLDDPTLIRTSPFDSLGIEDLLRLDQSERMKRRLATDELLAEITFHEKNRARWISQELRRMKVGDVIDVVIRDPELRVDHLMRTLHLAVGIDPSHSGAWFRLGGYARNLGDFALARRAFAMAGAAALVDTALPRPEFVVQMAAVKEAWCCRARGDVQDGLALIERIRGASGLVSLESKIIAGLLLADAGRFQEAYDLSMSIDAVEFPDIGTYHTGLRNTRSNYVRCWIQAMAWVGIGEPGMARHALGELRFYRVAFPFKSEYWNDVGLVCELSGRVEDCRMAYGLSMSTKRVLLPFVNWDAFSTPPVILGQPDVMVPCITSYETRLFGGSTFTLAAQLLAESAQTEDDSLKMARGAAALDALLVCRNRNIRPSLALALCGRAHYYMGNFDEAERDLREARARLADEGLGDAGTELVLGTILVGAERNEEALEFLGAAVAYEPELAGAWRTLGVTYATLGRHDEAEAAMDRALELDPESSLGWHNRGLFYASRERWPEAMTDLGVAVRLAPWNQEARDLLQRVTLELRDADQGPAALSATARADSLADSITRLADGRLEQQPGVITLGGSAGRATAMAVIPDFDVVADSLAAEHAAAPTPGIRRELADAYLHAGRSSEALALLGGLPETEMELGDLVLLLRADRDLGDPARAIRLVADLGGPGDRDAPDLWSLVALICLDQGYDAEGRLALDRALELDPGNKGLQAYRQFLVGRSGP